jgi:hypothetical protein
MIPIRQERKIRRKKYPGWLAYCLAACYTLVDAHLIFNPEDGGDTFVQRVDSHMDYMALYYS